MRLAEEDEKWINYLGNLGDDRSAIIVACTRVEEKLASLIIKIIPPLESENETKSDIDKIKRLANTYSKKIYLAKRLRLIDKEFGDTLEKIGLLRNKFAHTSKLLTLRENLHLTSAY